MCQPSRGAVGEGGQEKAGCREERVGGRVEFSYRFVRGVLRLLLLLVAIIPCAILVILPANEYNVIHCEANKSINE